MRNDRSPRGRRALAAAALAVLAAAPAHAQAGDEVTPHLRSVTHFGAGLSNREAGLLLAQMHQLAQDALATSRAAEQAATVPEIKAAADRVLQAVWGHPSGALDPATPEVAVLGWKERWQVTGAEFDPKWQERLGTRPPTITDPAQLGIMGRGRAARERLKAVIEAPSTRPAEREAARRALASLNDVIGWTHITKGIKVTEVQPRISLTYVWDMPAEFWNSSADTGWLPEVYSQAVNILKTDYQGDVAEARRHAAGMTELLTRVLQGTDADGNGVVEAKVMEGGLVAAVNEAGLAGVRAQ